MNAQNDYWKKVLQSAQKQLGAKRTERDTLETQLNTVNTEVVQLEQLVQNLIPLATEEPHDSTIRVEGVSDLELADAIREVLQQSAEYRTARGVRDSLRVSGYDLDQHPNALASIHGVLKRLVSSGEVQPLNAKGIDYYRWKADADTLTKAKTETDNLRRIREPKKDRYLN